MWVMTKIGFFSIVQHHNDTGTIVVRTRKKEDLLKFIDVMDLPMKPRVYATPNRDYKYRVYLRRSTFEAHFYHVLLLLDYTNFKNEVAKDNKYRAHLYSKVWGTLLAIEDEEKMALDDVFDSVEEQEESEEPNDL